METEQARHETEESLILAQFGTSHKISDKLQNGDQCSKGDSRQTAEDTNWNHYKASTGANSMKRHRDNCSSPASVQGLFDQPSYMMNGELMNGELKHPLNDQPLVVHQPKKLKTNPEFKGNDDLSSSLVDNFPELTKTTEFECNTSQTEIKLDKRNCNFPNGDIFGLPRNKHASVPNGAVTPSANIESTPGDLLQKTLSQYYPEQVSIAQQTTGPQLDAVNGSFGNKSDEGAQPLSGLPNSAQNPNSQQQQPGVSASVEGGNSYNSVNYIVNGYSKDFEAHHHQQQQPFQQRQPFHSVRELSLGQLADPSSKIGNMTEQDQNGQQCYPDDTNPQDTFLKGNQEINQNSLIEQNISLQSADTGVCGSFPNPVLQNLGQNEGPVSGQPQHHDSERGQQRVVQQQTLKQNAVNTSRAGNMGSMGPSLQQLCHVGSENGTENSSQQRANFSCSISHQIGWTDLNSSHSQQQPKSGLPPQAHEQDMWGGFPARSQSEPQTTNPVVHRQMLDANQVHRFQTQDAFTDNGQGSKSFQQQQQNSILAQTHCAPGQHNTAPEWQQSNSKAPELHQTLPQKLPKQCNFPPSHQAESHFSMQSEHLCEDPDLQDILSSGFSASQQQQHCHLQRPLSHPPQSEEQQIKSPNYRPRSQPQPIQQQTQPTQLLRNNSALSNNQHADYNNSTEMQQPQQYQRQYPSNFGSSNPKQFPPQRPNNHCQQRNHEDISQPSTQLQPQLLPGKLMQQGSTQIYPKDEQQMKVSCTHLQRGPHLPLRPVGPHGEFQRHEALRTHLLLKQERQGLPHPPQSISDPTQGLGSMKMENQPIFELPGSQQQKPTLPMQVQVKQENQQSLCEQSRRQGSILASMEESLRQYQLSPVFEKKSMVINSLNKVKVESSGAVTILSTNNESSGMESLAASTANVALKKPPDSTPKKENLLQSFIDSPMKLLDTPIKNLLETPMKTQYEIASCHCVGKFLDMWPEISSLVCV